MAKTDFFKPLEEWRRRTGRNVKNGSRRIPYHEQTPPPGQPAPPADLDEAHLIAIALRAQADRTTRADLRPIYLELAEVFSDLARKNRTQE